MSEQELLSYYESPFHSYSKDKEPQEDKEPQMVPVEPYYETDENGKLESNSFSLFNNPNQKLYRYTFASFNFEGHKVFITGRLGWVTEVIRNYYEQDVFEVGFDELLLFQSRLAMRRYLESHDFSTFADVTCHEE